MLRKKKKKKKKTKVCDDTARQRSLCGSSVPWQRLKSHVPSIGLAETPRSLSQKLGIAFKDFRLVCDCPCHGSSMSCLNRPWPRPFCMQIGRGVFPDRAEHSSRLSPELLAYVNEPWASEAGCCSRLVGLAVSKTYPPKDTMQALRLASTFRVDKGLPGQRRS